MVADDVRGLEAIPSGNVVVGIPTSLGIALTVSLALTIRRLYPKIHLRVTEGLSGHMSQWLLSGELDFALMFDAEHIAGVVKDRVAKEHLNLVGVQGSAALLDGGEIAASEIFCLPLILPGRPHGLREEVERAASRQGVKPNIVLEIDSLEHIKALVAEDAGYTILSRRVADHGAIAGRLKYRPISDPAIERTIYLARSSSKPLSSAAAAVNSVLLDMFTAHQSSKIVQ